MKFKVGDMVKVVRGVRSYARDGMGAGKQWVTVWLEEMDETIGGVYRVVVSPLHTVISLCYVLSV